jgi:hypothetical protein
MECFAKLGGYISGTDQNYFGDWHKKALKGF